MYLSNFHSQIWLSYPFDLHSFPAALLSKWNFRLCVCCAHVKSGHNILMLTMLAVFTVFSPFMVHATTCRGLSSLYSSLFLPSFSQSFKPNKPSMTVMSIIHFCSVYKDSKSSIITNPQQNLLQTHYVVSISCPFLCNMPMCFSKGPTLLCL
jgi:hypothetical protein